MNLESIKKTICALVIVMLSTGIYNSLAQPGSDPPDNPPVPISGIGYLLALGSAIGVKKIYDLRKHKKD